jgi:hypothetical protein
MYVQEIWRYPVKSMAGERVVAAELGALGVPGDRELAVVEPSAFHASGRVVTARTRPALLLHRATIDESGAVRVDGLGWREPEIAPQGVGSGGSAGAPRAVRGRRALRHPAALGGHGRGARRARDRRPAPATQPADRRGARARGAILGGALSRDRRRRDRAGLAPRALCDDHLGSDHPRAGPHGVRAHPHPLRGYVRARRLGRATRIHRRRRPGQPSPTHLDCSPAPRCHCASKEARERCWAALRELVDAFRVAAEKLKHGDLTVAFPEGSFPPPRQFVPVPRARSPGTA